MDILGKFQLEMAIKQQSDMLPEFMQLCKLTATQMKMYYDSLIEAGFTEEQAMDLLAFHGIDAGRISHMGNRGEDDER